MNAFRITLLVLLALVIALMFYAVQVVVPGWQGRYEEYTATQRVNELQMRTEAHRARISQLAPEVDSPEVAAARTEDMQTISANAQTLIDAEEQSVIAEARRAEEAQRVREVKSEVSAPAPLGLVAAYDAEWGVIFIRPVSNEPMNNGFVVAIRRGNMIVCEATVDGRDEESGQYTATVKSVSSGAIKVNPQQGDEVIVSPFMSAGELRNSNNAMPMPSMTPAPIPAAAQTPAAVPATGQGAEDDDLPSIPLDYNTPSNGLPEEEATLKPVP